LQAIFLAQVSGFLPSSLAGQASSTRGGSLKALEEGAYIKHFQYGLGVVTESNSDRTSIDFDLHGMKKFVTSIMVVDAAEGTPPKRRRAKKIKKLVAAVPAPAMAAGAK
jgi:hypothetical protein